MKYTLLFVLCSLFSIGAFAANAPALTQQVQRAVQRSRPLTNTGAIHNNSRLDFYITEYVFYEGHNTYGPFRADLACKAYPLDSHWLIVAGTCMRADNSDIWREGDHKLITRFDRKVYLKNEKPFTTFQNNPRVMLVWSEQAQYEAPFVNVLAVSSPKQLFSLSQTHQVQIHTARYGQNAAFVRQFDTHSANGNQFKLNEKWVQFSGTATDPLFLIAPDTNEFLAGYNDGILHYNYLLSINELFFKYDGLPSDIWYSLTEDDLNFIRDTVQAHRPQDWPHISQRLFFNTTDKPCIK